MSSEETRPPKPISLDEAAARYLDSATLDGLRHVQIVLRLDDGEVTGLIRILNFKGLLAVLAVIALLRVLACG